jgi:hypothetical protein
MGSARSFVMPGLDPGIHLLTKKFFLRRKMDCRVKSGNDEVIEAQ